MNKKKIAITIFVSIILIIIVGCSDMNPFSAGGVVPGGNWIYFVEVDQVKKMHMDGTGSESVVSLSYVYTSKIQLDPIRQKIYILNSDPALDDSIYEYNLDGSDEQLIYSQPGINTIWDMTIDHTNGYLYFIPGFNGIKSYNLETSQIEDVYTLPLGTTPFFVTSDYKGGVYFVETGELRKVVSLSSNNLITNVGSIYGLSYDRVGTKIYTTSMTGMIYNINPIGGNSSGISTSEDLQGGGIAISTAESKIYFYDANAMIMPYTIFSINMDGSGKKTVYSNDIGINTFDILSK